jgi:hypothetical protein
VAGCAKGRHDLLCKHLDAARLLLTQLRKNLDPLQSRLLDDRTVCTSCDAHLICWMDTAAGSQQPCCACSKRLLGLKSFTLFTAQIQRTKTSADAGVAVTAGVSCRRVSKQSAAALRRPWQPTPAASAQSIQLAIQPQTPRRYRPEPAWQVTAAADPQQAAAASTDQVCHSRWIHSTGTVFGLGCRHAARTMATVCPPATSVGSAAAPCRRHQGAAAMQWSCESRWVWCWRRTDTAASTWCVGDLTFGQSPVFACHSRARPAGPALMCLLQTHTESRLHMAAGSMRNEVLVTTGYFAVQAEVTEGGNADKSGLVSKVQWRLLNFAVGQATSPLRIEGGQSRRVSRGTELLRWYCTGCAQSGCSAQAAQSSASAG